jgi:hypothetical protein
VTVKYCTWLLPMILLMRTSPNLLACRQVRSSGG